MLNLTLFRSRKLLFASRGLLALGILLGIMLNVQSAVAVDQNVALNKPVTTSNEQVGNEATHAVDGNTTTRWAGSPWPQWIRVDLGATYTIYKTELMPYASRAYQYKVEVSLDDVSYTLALDKTTNTTGGATLTDTFTPVAARYVRLTTTGASGYTGGWVSYYEFRVFTDVGTPTNTAVGPTNTPTNTSVAPTNTPTNTSVPPTNTPTNTPAAGCGSTNIALNKPPSVSSTENAGTPGSAAVDGSTTTRWSSAFSDPQWIYVDLGSTYSICRVRLNWEAAYAKSYQIQLSNDTTSWTTIYSTTTGDGGIDDLTGLSGSGRYVRMYGTVRATPYGYSLWEFEIYAGTSGPTATPTPTNTSGPSPTPTNTPVGGPVDFGPNVHIFDTSMSASSIQSVINSVYSAQQNNQFGDRRDALVFKPGTYAVDIPVGFYTEVLGLGAAPDEVNITGNLHSDAYLSGNNATQNFWRGATNLKVTPSNGTVKWAVSQAIWFRQMHVQGNLVLHQNGGWASGGWMANTQVDNNVDFGSQQQWISRNTQAASWSGGAWNMVFVGVANPPTGTWPSPPYTKIATTPIIREKPFLQIDGSGNYSVRVPSFKSNSSGYDWGGGSVPGTTIPISQFYIAHAGDSAATLNAQLAAGKHLLLTPGIYTLNDTIRVNNPNTVVLGMGLATLRPTTGLASLTVGDVDGVIIAGVLFDAGITNSPVQLEVGTSGNTTSHAANPIVLHDVIFRVGGAAAGKTTVSMRINAYDTIVDHTWVWRADHGSGVGWTSNTANNGVVVNGNNVTMYGLFVEHYQQFQTLWNGQGGRVYFYQSEDPYDPPNQASWTSGTGINGWASYKLSNSVTSHEAWGLGVYSVFSNTGVNQTRAIEVPVNANVKFHDMVIKDLANGNIQYVINNTVGPTVTNFP